MPKGVRQRRREVVKKIDSPMLAWLRDEGPKPTGYFFLYGDDADERLREIWDEHKAEIVAEWAQAKPGTRPRCWWQFDAPEPRQRVGGKGTACHDVMNYVPYYEYGMPVAWVGEPSIGRGVKAQPFDRDDPPTYEAEATYLARLKLFERFERSNLLSDAMEPEAVPEDWWPRTLAELKADSPQGKGAQV